MESVNCEVQGKMKLSAALFDTGCLSNTLQLVFSFCLDRSHFGSGLFQSSSCTFRKGSLGLVRFSMRLFQIGR